MSNCSVDVEQCIKNKQMKLVLMDKFKCHKEVHALPMTRGVYNKVRGWDTPFDENPDDEGYLVTYNIGTTDEYVSWSPKIIFDEGYTKI